MHIRLDRMLGKFLGFVSAYLAMSILGLISIFSPQLSDEILEALIRWSESE